MPGHLGATPESPWGPTWVVLLLLGAAWAGCLFVVIHRLLTFWAVVLRVTLAPVRCAGKLLYRVARHLMALAVQQTHD